MNPAGTVNTTQDLRVVREAVWNRKLRFFSHIQHNVLVIGHRGACGLFPENTMISFRSAAEMGADMIELDVQLSADGIPVVSHDTTVNRCTDGKGYIHAMTFSELRKLDAGRWFSRRFRGERIPSLKEVLVFCKDTIAVNIELKSDGHIPAESLVDRTLETVATAGIKSQVLFSSFDTRILELIRNKWPDSVIGLLFEKDRKNRVDPVEIIHRLKADSFHISKRDMGMNLREVIAKQQLPYLVYTVNRPGEMKKWILNGAGGFFTNRPDIGRSVVDTYTPARRE